jgi:hypothetical protein
VWRTRGRKGAASDENDYRTRGNPFLRKTPPSRPETPQKILPDAHQGDPASDTGARAHESSSLGVGLRVRRRKTATQGANRRASSSPPKVTDQTLTQGPGPTSHPPSASVSVCVGAKAKTLPFARCLRQPRCTNGGKTTGSLHPLSNTPQDEGLRRGRPIPHPRPTRRPTWNSTHCNRPRVAAAHYGPNL